MLFGESRHFKNRYDPTLDARVLEKVGEIPRHFSDLAEELDEVPWDVLAACQALTVRDLLDELPEPRRGFFQKRSAQNHEKSQ